MVQIIQLLPVMAAFIGAAQAHTRVWGIAVNGVNGGTGTNGDARSNQFIRSPPNNDPVKDVSSDNIICNVNGLTEAPKWLATKAGDKLDITWYHDNFQDDIIASSHKGPVTVYIAPAESNGKGKVWSKLYEDGYSSGQWAVDKLIANKGVHSLTLPSGLAKGKYLLRAEIIAHHESETDYSKNSARGAQFYPSCSQIEVTSGGSATVPGGYGFKASDGGYTTTDPGILFNIYGSFSSYPIPGPAVWSGTGSGAVPAPVVTSAAPTTVKITSTAAVVPTTAVVVPTRTPSAVVTSTPVVVPTRVPTTVKAPTFTTSATVKPTTAAPVATAAPSLPKDRNLCFDEANRCYSAAQPKNGLGTPEAEKAYYVAWAACQGLWNICETL